MKFRLLALLFSTLPFVALAAEAPAAAAAAPTATTIKRTAVHVGSASIPLTPGTKLEVLGRDGDSLVVKFRSTKGTITLADTDFDPATELPTAPAGEKPAVKPAATAAAPTPAAPAAAKATPPPALSLDQKPASNYGKMVQKAKQVEQAHHDKLVNPTDEILDDGKTKK